MLHSRNESAKNPFKAFDYWRNFCYCFKQFGCSHKVPKFSINSQLEKLDKRAFLRSFEIFGKILVFVSKKKQKTAQIHQKTNQRTSGFYQSTGWDWKLFRYNFWRHNLIKQQILTKLTFWQASLFWDNYVHQNFQRT